MQERFNVLATVAEVTLVLLFSSTLRACICHVSPPFVDVAYTKRAVYRVILRTRTLPVGNELTKLVGKSHTQQSKEPPPEPSHRVTLT